MDWFKKTELKNKDINYKSKENEDAKKNHENALDLFKKENEALMQEYDRKVESLALLVFEKGEENEELLTKLKNYQQNEQKLNNQLKIFENEISTYKENQIEYKRRLEVLTDCLEDLARENMKLASKSTPAKIPDDYEEEHFPTTEQVKTQQTKSNFDNEMRNADNKKINNDDNNNNNKEKISINTNVVDSSNKISLFDDPKLHKIEINKTSKPPSGGLFLPSKPKEKINNDIIQEKNPSVDLKVTNQTTTQKPVEKNSTNENEFSDISNDPKSLMVLLKKYKAQSEQLRRVYEIFDYFFYLF